MSKYYLKKALVACFFALMQFSSAFTQDLQTDDKYDTITVVATKKARDSFAVPSMTSTQSKESPLHKNSQTLPELLRDVNGADFTGGPVRNGYEPRIRGYSGSGVIVLLDGARQNFNSGHSGRLFVEPELLKQVEVSKGTQSAIYGSGGLGGVVALTTKDAADMLDGDKKYGNTLKSNYSSVRNESMISASSYGKTDKLDIVSSLVYRDSGNIKLGNGQTLTNSSDKILSSLFKTTYKIDDNQKIKFNLQASTAKSKEFANPQQAGDKTISPQDSAFLTDKKTNTYLASIAYNLTKGKNLNLETNLYNTYTSVDYTSITNSSKTAPLGTKRDRSYNTTGFDIQNKHILNPSQSYKNTLIYGLNYFKDTQKANSNGNLWSLVPNGQNTLYGLFAQNEIDISTKAGQFIILPAIRYDRYKSTSKDIANSKDVNDAFSPKLGISYKPQSWALLFTSYSYGFRAPNITEKYASGQHYAIPIGPSKTYVNSFVANPHLKAERNRTLEIGFGFDFKDKIQSSDRLTFKASVYNTQSFDYINQIITDSFYLGYGTTQYKNVSRATIKGFEAEAKYQSNNIGLDLGYSYVNAYENGSGLQLFSSTPRTLKANIYYNLSDFVFGWRATFAKSFDYTTTNSAYELNPNPKTNGGNYFSPARAGYAVHDIYAQYSIGKNININAGIDNLFNKPYRLVNTANYQPGRSFKLGTSYDF